MNISEELKNLKREKASRPDIYQSMSAELIRQHRVHNRLLYEEALRAVKLKELEIAALENAMRKQDPLDPGYQAYVDAWNEAQNVLGDLGYLVIVAHDNYRLYT